MSIASLSLTFVQYNSTADFARTQGAVAPRPAPGVATPAPAPTAAAPASCQHTCDSPRRSPLYRALMDALGSLVPSTPSAPAGSPVAASAPPAPATAPPATPATDAVAVDTPPDLEEAVTNFARALMQAVRGSGRDEGDDDRERGGHHRHAHHEHGHHHRHHDHGRRAWGDPAQRIDALGARWGASPSPRPNTAPALPLDPVPTTPPVALTDVTLDPVVATDLGAAKAVPKPTPLPAIASDTVAPRRDRYGLLDAFSALQRALGLPAAEGRGGLETQLGAFLHTLAERLRGGEANSAAATTQPGALLDVTA